MPIITHVLLYLAYAAISLAVGAALNQVGGQDIGAAFLGGIGLFCACAVTHASISASAAAGRIGGTEQRIKHDMERLRTAHREITADIDAVQARLDQIETQVADALAAPPQPPQLEAPQPSGQVELKLIDQIVDKLGAAMDARLQTIQSAGDLTPINPSAARGPMDLGREAILENRVELHLQPIVQLPQRKTAFYEGFTRLKDASGRLILPQEFIPAAEQAGLMTTIDNVLLFRCVQLVRKLQRRNRNVGFFCNISAHTLADDEFFDEFLEFLAENTDLARNLVFEFVQSDIADLTPAAAANLQKLGDLGFRFSLDQVHRLDLNYQELSRRYFRFMKVDAPTLLAHLGDKGPEGMRAFKRVLDSAAIDIVVEKIEDERTLKELLDYHIDFGQGFLFGEPRPARDL